MSAPLAVQKAAIEIMKGRETLIDGMGATSNTWQIDFFTPSGKWKYTDYVVMTKPDKWTDFTVLINDALRNTPEELRETNIKELGGYWTAVMLQNPLGFPIMVISQ
jgi:hypothetical protein